MTATVFPTAAPTIQGHPRDCACQTCTDRLVADLREPIITPGPRMDPALDRRRRR